MHEEYKYLSSVDFKRIAADLLPLLDAVLEHSNTLQPEIVKVYEPYPLPRRIASTLIRTLSGKMGQRPVNEMLGYEFSDPFNPNIIGVIVVIDEQIYIATPYQPVLRRTSDLYILHSKLDAYVEVCLAGDMIGAASVAQINVDRARYAIERLLPDGHEMKRPERAVMQDASVDGRAVT